MTDWLRN